MNRLRVHFRVKFRAFFITFATIEDTVTVPLPFSLPLPTTAETVIYNARGVWLAYHIN